MASTQMTPEMETLKSRLRGMWIAGDFGQIAKSIEHGAVELVGRLNLKPGMKVLDVATGLHDRGIQDVAAGLIEATHDLIVLVAVWVDERADDETALRAANREAVGKALRMCIEGREAGAVARLVAERDTVTSPFYSGE